MNFNHVLISLGQNIGLLLSATLVYGMLVPWLHQRTATQRGLVVGLFFSLVALIGMLVPVDILTGITIDGRIVVVALASALGGPMAALVAPILPVVYRAYQGGVGAAPGICSLIGATIVGALAHRHFDFAKKARAHVVPVYFALLGLAAAAQALLWTFVLPLPMALNALGMYFVPVVIAYPSGCFLLGTLLLQQHQRHAMVERITGLEARLRALSDNLPNSFVYQVVHERDGTMRFEHVSAGVQRLLGLAPEAIMKNARLLYDRIANEDLPSVVAAEQQSAATMTVFNVVVRMRTVDGQLRWGHLCSAPRPTPDGRIIWDGIHVDITAAKDAEEQRAILEAHLLQVRKLEALGTLAGGVAHEFNNLLAVIGGHSDFLRLTLTSDMQADEGLCEINKAVARARTLVDQILAFGGKQPSHQRVMPVKPIMTEAFSFLRATIPAGVAMNLAMPEEEVFACVDPSQLRQVIVNLGTNAWQSLRSPEEKGNVELQLTTETLLVDGSTQTGPITAGTYVRITVIDDGSGLTSEAKERIFEPFFTTKPVGKGTGLGLSMVHGTVMAHGGAIRVDTLAGRGTRFDILLPAAHASDHDATIPASVQTTTRIPGKRILYLDDEESLVLLMTRVLRRLGYVVEGHSDPAIALRIFEERPDSFDLVVTDLNMPGSSGLDIIEAMLKRRPELAVVLCSGYVTAELAERARALGARALLYKPESIEAFSQAIDQVLAS